MTANINKYIGAHIKERRELLKMTANDLADKVGVSRATITRYEIGMRKISQDKLFKIADALKCSVTDFYPKDSTFIDKNKLPRNAIELDNSKVKMVPLVGTIAMGTPITAEQNVEKYIPEFFLEDIPANELIALHCKGYSMEPTIPDGAIAIIHLQPDVEDDEIAAVLVDDDCEATLKRVQHIGNQVFLVPDNKNYKPIVLNKENPGRIIGKMIKYEVTTK